jgi:uncharacterized ion transporter superfamily protein YfcC
MLLAFLAAADIPSNRWLRVAGPLFLLLAVLSAAATMLAVAIGY